MPNLNTLPANTADMLPRIDQLIDQLNTGDLKNVVEYAEARREKCGWLNSLERALLCHALKQRAENNRGTGGVASAKLPDQNILALSNTYNEAFFTIRSMGRALPALETEFSNMAGLCLEKGYKRAGDLADRADKGNAFGGFGRVLSGVTRAFKPV